MRCISLGLRGQKTSRNKAVPVKGKIAKYIGLIQSMMFIKSVRDTHSIIHHSLVGSLSFSDAVCNSVNDLKFDPCFKRIFPEVSFGL